VIRNYIDENEIDLTVMGTHGQTDFSRYVMGGVSAKLVRTSPVPVLWVRESESDIISNS
jgi:nucleotide-binding universal stress UspA family protein